MPGNVAGAIASGVASLVGIPIQNYYQEKLMDKTAALNLEQWERENAYNSPVEQMKRLRAAGLNPDLAIGGNVANTAAHSQNTAGTPAAPPAAASVATAVQNAQQASLLAAQEDALRATARKDNATAGETENTTAEQLATFSTRFDILLNQLEVDKSTRENIIASTKQLEQQVLALQQSIENMKSEQKLVDAQTKTEGQNYYIASSQANMFLAKARYAKEFAFAELDKLMQSAEVDRQTAFNLSQQTKLLIDTYVQQCEYFTHRNNSLLSQIGMHGAIKSYYDAQANYLEESVKYLPYIYSEQIFGSENMFEHDEKGNVVLKDNGVPKINDSWRKLQNGLQIAGECVQILDGVTSSVGNLVPAFAAMKNAKAFGQSVNQQGAFYQQRISLEKERNNLEYNKFNFQKQKYDDYKNSLQNSQKPSNYTFDKNGRRIFNKPWTNRPMTEKGVELVKLYNSLDPNSPQAKYLFEELKKKSYYRD